MALPGIPELVKDIGRIYPEFGSVESRLSDVLASQSQMTDEMTRYLADSGGNRLRPALVVLAAGMGHGQADAVIDTSVAAELIHIASLVHDDIIDEADTRRGRPTAGKKWGNSMAVLAGDYLFATAFGLLARRGLYNVLNIMTEAIKAMCEGEIEQAANTHNLDIREETYMKHIRKKTASLIEACCGAGAMVAGLSDAQVSAARQYGLSLGYAFQIVDDVMDFGESSDAIGKPVGLDITRGVMTLPLVEALKSKSHGGRVRQILLGETADEDMRRLLRDAVLEAGGVSYAYDKANTMVAKAKESLMSLPDAPSREMLFKLADFVTVRSY
jgi:heptaprenyl diphosphate synthase